MRLPHICSSAFTLFLGVSLLSVKLSPAVHAQPPMGRPGRQRPTPAQMEAGMFQMIEKGMGKKLTAAQKQQLRQAFKDRQVGHLAVETKFQARVAKTLGMTPQQLQAKMRQTQGRR